MPAIRESGLLLTAIQFLLRIHPYLLDQGVDINVLFTTLEALSLLVDTEDFETYKKEYIKDEADAVILIRFKEIVLQPYLSDMAKKKLIRSLIDCIDRAKRQYKL